LAKGVVNESVEFQIRIRETSPKPATEIMLPIATAVADLDVILKELKINRKDLFWIHPRAGGTLRRHVVDVLIANLEEQRPLVQTLIGPRQVGKTTSVEHLMKEWGAAAHYASADSIVDDYGPWLEGQWQEALQKGEGSLLVIDEIQKIENWQEHVKLLWDKTQARGLRVVLLGSTSLNHCLTPSGRESLAGRFNSIYVPHWSFLETREAFGVNSTDYSLFGGYPKAMELSANKDKWSEYVGKSIINPIIDVDIYQLGNFKRIESLRRAFKVFCNEVSTEINYTHFLKEIQHTGNTEIVKRYLEGYYDSFLLSPINLVDDNGNLDYRANPKLMTNCPAVYTFGRSSFDDFSKDSVRFQQSVAGELKRIPNLTFGHWKKSETVGMDFFLKTTDNNTFGVFIEDEKGVRSATKSYDLFRKTFKGSRILSINQGNFSSLLEGQRAFLEMASI
jgi:predicted AAA+ superfamily ATPase